MHYRWCCSIPPQASIQWSFHMFFQCKRFAHQKFRPPRNKMLRFHFTTWHQTKITWDTLIERRLHGHGISDLFLLKSKYPILMLWKWFVISKDQRVPNHWQNKKIRHGTSEFRIWHTFFGITRSFDDTYGRSSNLAINWCGYEDRKMHGQAQIDLTCSPAANALRMNTSVLHETRNKMLCVVPCHNLASNETDAGHIDFRAVTWTWHIPFVPTQI